MLLLGSQEIDPSKAVAWDCENHLGFAVPFQDMKPEIYLGRTEWNTILEDKWARHDYVIV